MLKPAGSASCRRLIYTLSPDGKSAVYPDFRRLNDCRPGYGYTGIPDPNLDVKVPDDAGIWHLDIASGKTKLLIPFSEVERIPYPNGYPAGAKHWFNHLLYSTDGSRFIFLHRWRGEAEPITKFSTRMFTADRNGGDLFILDPHGKTSHFIWRDPKNMLAWAWHPSQGDKFYLFEDKTENVEPVGPDVMTVNGHCTYLPGSKFILNDTYPDQERNQNPYLYEVATGNRTPLGLIIHRTDIQASGAAIHILASALTEKKCVSIRLTMVDGRCISSTSVPSSADRLASRAEGEVQDRLAGEKSVPSTRGLKRPHTRGTGCAPRKIFVDAARWHDRHGAYNPAVPVDRYAHAHRHRTSQKTNDIRGHYGRNLP